MQHFPIFLAVAGRRIVLSGGGDAAMAKLRLLMKTKAHLTVIAPDVTPRDQRMGRRRQATHHRAVDGTGRYTLRRAVLCRE